MLERGHHRRRIVLAKGHDKDRGVLQIGADAHLSHGNIGVQQGGIMRLVGGKQLRQGVAQLLTNAQLTLARWFAFVFGHGLPRGSNLTNEPHVPG